MGEPRDRHLGVKGLVMPAQNKRLTCLGLFSIIRHMQSVKSSSTLSNWGKDEILEGFGTQTLPGSHQIG